MSLSVDTSIRIRRAPLLAAIVILFTVTVTTFWPVSFFPFVDWDDCDYVYENEAVKGGLTAAGLRSAFTTIRQENWHPLTWASHMLDVEFFGMNAGAHHLTSLALHLVSATLLLLVLQRCTGMLWRAAVVSLLFAVHPLHVESVAWVSERKDVLAGLFWVLTMACYLWHVRKPGRGRYALLLAMYVFGLMAKPMLVTLPLVLLLLDYWPLGRLSPPRAGYRPTAVRRLLIEKIPLLVPALGSSAITWFAQAGIGKAAVSLAAIPLALRIENAVASYATYLARMVLPTGMALFYPYPIDGIPYLHLGGAVLLLGSLTVFTVQRCRTSPWLPVGWGWYVVTLAPVIGVIQVGMQARADRYTYLPLIGPFIMVVWAGADLACSQPRARVIPVAVAGVVTVVCVALARQQVGFWRDTETVMQHAIDVTPRNWVAKLNLGSYLTRIGRQEEGLALYRQAATEVPARAEEHFRRGVSLAEQGALPDAAAEFNRATTIHRPFADAHYRLGLVESRLGKTEKAIEHLRAAIGYRPDFVEAHCKRGVLLARLGHWEEAAINFAEALRHRPDYHEARYNLRVVMEGLGYGPGGDEVFLKSLGRQHEQRATY